MGSAEVEITQVRIFPVAEDKLKAFVSIIIDDCFVVSDIKIIEGTGGLFISMPSKKRKNGTFRDIAHPLNNETRRLIETRIIAQYREVVSESGDEDDTPIRELGAEQQNDAQGPAESAPPREDAEEDDSSWP
jgi:stage V sporulation protein G